MNPFEFGGPLAKNPLLPQFLGGKRVFLNLAGLSNLQVALWIQNNCDFDQLILEFWKEGEPNSGWVHCSYKEGSNRKQVLTYSGGEFKNGLPDAKWSDGKFAN
ncbi:MAG: hypothetical protein CM15mV114_190 [Caudoviricetes sp.]|nr:MAG: hypothetical protein CM15mV114_190 [Caudoviricetes sp.]